MKMIMISYNEAIDAEVMGALEKCSLKNYTKITATYGKGASSGTHLGTDIWPGKNNILFIACEDQEAANLLSAVRQLKKTLGQEGIKAFILPIEELT